MESRSSCNLRSNIRTHANVVGWLLTLAAIGLLLHVLQLQQATQQLNLLENKLPQIGMQLEQQLEEIDWGTSYAIRYALALGLIQSLFTALYWIGYLKRVRWCLTVTIVYMAISLVMGSIIIIYAFVLSVFYYVYLALPGLVVLGYALTVTHQLHSVMSASPFGFVVLVADNVTTKDSPNAKQTKQTNGTQIV